LSVVFFKNDFFSTMYVFDLTMDDNNNMFSDSDEDDDIIPHETKINPFANKGGLSGLGGLKSKPSIGGLAGLGSISGNNKLVKPSTISNFPMLKKPVTNQNKAITLESGSNVINEKFVDAITENNKEIMNTLTTLITNMSTKYVTKDELHTQLRLTQSTRTSISDDMSKIFEILDEKVSKYGRIIIDPNGKNELDSHDACVVTSLKEFLTL